MPKTWRDIARPIIQNVLTENAGKSEREIKKALKEAYPFGQRCYHPYKIWLDEIKVQTGKIRKKNIQPPTNQLVIIFKP